MRPSLRGSLLLASPCLWSLLGCPGPPDKGPKTYEYEEFGDEDDSAVTPQTPFSAEEQEQSRGRLGGVWTSCYEGFAPSGDTQGALSNLTGLCGPKTKMITLGPARMIAHDEPVTRLSFKAGELGKCFRLYAVASEQAGQIDITWRGPRGETLAIDTSRERWAVVPPRGPLCLDEPGAYTVEISTTSSPAEIAVQVWGDPG